MADLKYKDKDGWKSLLGNIANNVTDKLSKNMNLSDVDSVEESRENLGLTGDNNTTHYHDSRYLPLINKEIEDRKSADASLKEEIDKKLSDSQTSIGGNIDVLQQTIENKINSLIQEEVTERNNAIQKEADIRKAEDDKLSNSINNLNDKIAQEITDRKQADSNLQKTIEQEITNRQNAIFGEATDRQNADDELKKELLSNITSSENNLSTLIKQETTNREQADLELKKQLDSISTQIDKSLNNISVDGSTQGNSITFATTYDSPAKAIANQHKISTNTGIPAGTYSLQDLLNKLVAMSHTESKTTSVINCNCDCNCKCNTHSH